MDWSVWSRGKILDQTGYCDPWTDKTELSDIDAYADEDEEVSDEESLLEGQYQPPEYYLLHAENDDAIVILPAMCTC